ncbi:MAG TPA: hypothetical protein DCP90_02900 [Clostridiales bacterium]|nr:MAG: hypothetical protein A2Y22_03145 [Clostridiales bacterium GWD2_32_59]HAN09542.1 hypothetical protein [Clostridiales bacterium]
MDKKSVRVVRFDWAIKYMLRDKANFDVLEGLISALLKEDVTVINILESESNRDREEYKYNKVDLLVEDSRKRKIIIEIQNASETDFMERLIWGTSKVITESIAKGQQYEDIAKVISISIVYFNIMLGDDYIYKAYTALEPQKYRDFIVKENQAISWYSKGNKFPEYYILDLTKYKNEVQSDIDEWVYMLKNSEIKEEFKSRGIEAARIKLNELKMTVEELKEYERYMENQVILRDKVKTARREGREEGIEEGREEGRKAEKIELAKNLIGILDINTISETTGLSIAEVQKIKK